MQRQIDHRNFNSIKVQLKPEMARPIAEQDAIFQFHKGTIKASKRATIPLFLRYFNSIKVQLKPPPVDYSAFTPTNFNSIKVQLKHALFKWDVFGYKFQFHKGTIKADELPSLPLTTLISIP